MGWEPYYKTGWATIEGIRIRAIAEVRDPNRKLVRVTPVHALGLLPATSPACVSEIPESDFEPIPDDHIPAAR